MTIAERINLHRCGYTKEEINQLAEAEKAEIETIEADPAETPAPTPEQPAPAPAPTPEQPAPAPAPTPEQPAPVPAANNNVLDAIKELTKAIYSRNINATPQPAPNPETLTDMISKL